MDDTEIVSCSCGLIVIVGHDVDEVGLCVVCAGSGHDWACACLECGVYRKAIDEGAEPAAALELARSEVV